MEQPSADTPRVATVLEATTVASLLDTFLDTFNREYNTPTPGTAVLATRLERLLAGGEVIALLIGDPAVAVALLTLRPNVWYDGPVALLDELYVAPELRGRRLGSALLLTAEAMIRQRGGELLEINVDGDDIDARRYERHGYVNSEPVGHHLPKLLQQVRTNEDRILSHDKRRSRRRPVLRHAGRRHNVLDAGVAA